MERCINRCLPFIIVNVLFLGLGVYYIDYNTPAIQKCTNNLERIKTNCSCSVVEVIQHDNSGIQNVPTVTIYYVHPLDNPSQKFYVKGCIPQHNITCYIDGKDVFFNNKCFDDRDALIYWFMIAVATNLLLFAS